MTFNEDNKIGISIRSGGDDYSFSSRAWWSLAAWNVLSEEIKIIKYNSLARFKNVDRRLGLDSGFIMSFLLASFFLLHR